MHFSRQMAAFVRTGIPITEALEVVEDGSRNKRFRQIVATMREQINNGVPFSDALAEHSKVFPPYYIGILRSAELTGQLDTALEQLSGYIERDLEAKSKIKAAMVYPLVIFVHVDPHRRDPRGVGHAQVRRVLQEPPGEAAAAHAAAHRRVASLRRRSGSCGWRCSSRSCAVLVWMHKSAKGRLLRDRLFLQVPLVKDVVLFAVTERVCRIIGAMVKAGVPLPETLNAAIQGANNQVFEAGLTTARERMLEGEGLARPDPGHAAVPARREPDDARR